MDLETSSAHCGQCDHAAPTDAQCQNGEIDCSSPYDTLCSGVCVNLDSSGAHCGACGQQCPARFQCGSDDSWETGECYRSGTPPLDTSCTGYCTSYGAQCHEASYYNTAALEWFDVDCWQPYESWQDSFSCTCVYAFD